MIETVADYKEEVAKTPHRYPGEDLQPRFMCGALLPEIREIEPSHSDDRITGHGNPSPLAQSAGFPNGI
ncbi:hypothetical protein KGQ24_00550 [Patescibacteria group bacterium]|nr:hypothetical protein [Patescibacteria group bacterium]